MRGGQLTDDMITYNGAVGEWAAELEAGRLGDAVDGSLGFAWVDVSF